MDQITHRSDSCVGETLRIWTTVAESAQHLHEWHAITAGQCPASWQTDHWRICPEIQLTHFVRCVPYYRWSLVQGYNKSCLPPRKLSAYRACQRKGMHLCIFRLRIRLQHLQQYWHRVTPRQRGICLEGPKLDFPGSPRHNNRIAANSCNAS